MSKGYLQLCSLSSYSQYKDNFEKRLFIVRNPMNVDCTKYGMIHVPELSPSPRLFKSYLRWKKGIFTEVEQRYLTLQGPNRSWWDLYCSSFTDQIKHNEDMIINLNRIQELLDQGVNILLVCFCGDYVNCHRILLGNYFDNKGYTVYYN